MYYVIDLLYSGEEKCYFLFITYKEEVFIAYKEFLKTINTGIVASYEKRLIWIIFSEYAKDIYRLVLSDDQGANFAKMDETVQLHIKYLQEYGEG